MQSTILSSFKYVLIDLTVTILWGGYSYYPHSRRGNGGPERLRHKLGGGRAALTHHVIILVQPPELYFRNSFEALL